MFLDKESRWNFLNLLIGWWGSAVRGISKNTVLWVVASVIVTGGWGLQYWQHSNQGCGQYVLSWMSMYSIKVGKEECLRYGAKTPITWKVCLGLLGDWGVMITDSLSSPVCLIHSSEALHKGRLETWCSHSSHLSSQLLLFHPSDVLGHICLAEFPAPHPCHLSRWE